MANPFSSRHLHIDMSAKNLVLSATSDRASRLFMKTEKMFIRSGRVVRLNIEVNGGTDSGNTGHCRWTCAERLVSWRG